MRIKSFNDLENAYGTWQYGTKWQSIHFSHLAKRHFFKYYFNPNFERDVFAKEKSLNFIFDIRTVCGWVMKC